MYDDAPELLSFFLTYIFGNLAPFFKVFRKYKKDNSSTKLSLQQISPEYTIKLLEVAATEYYTETIDIIVFCPER